MSVAAATLKAVLEANTDDFIAAFTRADGKLTDFGLNLSTIDSAVTHLRETMAYEIAGVAAIFGGAAAAALPWEQKLRDVFTLVDEKLTSLDELRDKISMVATETRSELTPATEGYYQVISAGVTDMKDSIDVSINSAKLAKAGIGTMAGSVDIITKAFDNFGIAQSESMMVADQFMSITRDGKITIGELSQNYGDASIAASMAGASFTETNASLVKLSKSLGIIKGSTALAQMFNNIIKPSEGAKKEAKKLGIEFNTTALQSKGLIKFLQDLKDKTGGSSSALSKLFESTEALKAIGVLLSDLPAVSKEIDILNNSAGTTEEAFRKQLIPIVEFGKNVKWLVQQIGSRLLPVFNAIITPLNNIFEWFQKLNPVMQKTIEWIGIVLAALAPFRFFLMVLGVVLGNLGIVIPGLMAIVTNIIPIVISGLAFIIPWLIRAVPLIANIIGITNPIIWIISGIITLLIAIQSNFLGITDGVVKIWNVVTGSLSAIINAIFPVDKLLKLLGGTVDQFWATLGRVLKAIEIGLTRYISKAVEQLVQLVQSSTKKVLDFIEWIRQGLTNLLAFLAQFKSMALNIFNSMFGGMGNMISDLINKWDGLSAAAMKYLLIAWQAAKFVNPALGNLDDILKEVQKAYKELENITNKTSKTQASGNKQNNIGLDDANKKLKQQKDLLSDINKILSQNFRLAMARAWKDRGSWINGLNLPWNSSGNTYSGQIGPNGVLNGGAQYTPGRGTLQAQTVYKFVINGKEINLPGPENPTADQRKQATEQALLLYDSLDGIMGNLDKNKAVVHWDYQQ